MKETAKPILFPIQSERNAAPHPLRIPWEVAELAYSVYASKYGRGQSLERLAERGGFGPSEMDDFLPGWREMCSQLTVLEKRCQKAEEVVHWAQAVLTALNLGDVQTGSLLHLKLREIMIAYREDSPIPKEVS